MGTKAKPPQRYTAISAGPLFSVAKADDGSLWWWGAIPGSEAGRKPAPVGGADSAGAFTAGSGGPGVYLSDAGNTVYFLSNSVYTSSPEYDSSLVRSISDRVFLLLADGTISIRAPFGMIPSTQEVFAEGTFSDLDVSANFVATLVNGWNKKNTVLTWPVGAPDTRFTVRTIDDVVAVASGRMISYAIRADGSVWQWMGPLMGTYPEPPAAVKQQSGEELCGIKAIAAGGDAAMALDESGTVWTWGYGATGQLGRTGIDMLSANPAAQLSGLPPITAISMSSISALALDKNGQLWQWGTLLGCKAMDPPTQVPP